MAVIGSTVQCDAVLSEGAVRFVVGVYGGDWAYGAV